MGYYNEIVEEYPRVKTLKGEPSPDDTSLNLKLSNDGYKNDLFARTIVFVFGVGLLLIGRFIPSFIMTFDDEQSLNSLVGMQTALFELLKNVIYLGFFIIGIHLLVTIKKLFYLKFIKKNGEVRITNNIIFINTPTDRKERIILFKELKQIKISIENSFVTITFVTEIESLFFNLIGFFFPKYKKDEYHAFFDSKDYRTLITFIQQNHPNIQIS
jgi:hypothetical protein